MCVLKCISHIRLFETLWTVTCQALLSTGLSRQEYWSRSSCPLPEYLPDSGSVDWKGCKLSLQVKFESCKLSLVWGKMRTAAWETDSSERLLQRGSGGKLVYKMLVKGKFNKMKCLCYKMFSAGHEELMSSWKDSAFLDVKRYKDWDHEISSSNYLNTCFCQIPWGTKCLTSPWCSLRRYWRSIGFNPHRGRWQMALFSHWQCSSVQFGSVTQSSLTLCDPMDCSTSGFPVHHQLPGFTQTHVHRVSDAIQPSHPLSSPSPPALNLSQHQGLFQWVSSSYQVAKVLEFQLQHQSFKWIFRTDFL